MAEKTRRIRIEADSHDPMNQRVIDVETGETIEGVTAVDVKLRPGELPQALLVIEDFDLGVEAEADVSLQLEFGAPL